MWSADAGGLRAACLPLQAEASANAGLLALLGVRQQRHEVYGLGVFAGSRTPELSIQRLGSRLLVLVGSAGCATAAPGLPCSSSVRLYALERGELSMKGEIPTERRERRVLGRTGTFDYHFEAALTFQAKRIHVDEHLSIRDAARGDGAASVVSAQR